MLLIAALLLACSPARPTQAEDTATDDTSPATETQAEIGEATGTTGTLWPMCREKPAMVGSERRSGRFLIDRRPRGT